MINLYLSLSSKIICNVDLKFFYFTYLDICRYLLLRAKKCFFENATNLTLTFGFFMTILTRKFC